MILVQMSTLASSTSNVWMNMSSYPPHFVQDHVLAGCLFVALYVAECAGILRSFTSDAPAAGPLLVWLAALPKMMLPASFTPFKQMWLRSPYFSRVAAAESPTGVLPTTSLFLVVLALPVIEGQRSALRDSC